MDRVPRRRSTAGGGGLTLNNSFRDNVISVLVQNQTRPDVAVSGNAFPEHGTRSWNQRCPARGERDEERLQEWRRPAIDFQGDPSELSTGVVVSYNKTGNERLLSIANTDHATVIGNKQVNAGSQPGINLRDAGGNYSLLIKGNRLGETWRRAQGRTRIPERRDDRSDHRREHQQHRRVGDGQQVSAWLTRSSYYGDEIGIYIDSGRGNQITYNSAGGGVHDCQDLTVGVDGQPLNLWRNNSGYGNNSSPANLCLPQSF